MPTWKEVTEANPAHSHNYARRWTMLKAQGKDIHGEARLIDAMVERNSSILDAGCGTGRVGGELLRRGHSVMGVDIDPILIEHAEHDFPDGEWFVRDLCTDQIPEGPFDLAVSAGNVMGFLAVDGREEALRNIFNSLTPGGRFVTGFGEGRGWGFQDFLDMAQKVGYRVDFTFSSWDMKLFSEHSAFLVAVLSRPGADLLA
ncbi:methyltransferase domain-containing protein [Corynebacterium macginleyi]|uniref:class I SAM-dependent methyltransferase n=1 Tax=Corynebacterium macginleyi TaxID=38290 RepID=UPI000EF9E159|nr:class I SAM-dependent methyltransferase [Corynebacterium macginleyi]MBK4140906.1 methyltransferase domain-containing protein [Corynebacterium macginleyi]MBK4143213.1 methyltransferase domain-containing protein [Corynebacterium macginleyi]MBK4148623.1 methyltransferase domain-containing protein [Corynebacterium macginleyi]MBK4158863.1 methyltransferase domain-containing protein [Corynebacterium macginleyi]MBK4164908.1 methyltransferase domain-containing protein [Corynebacterium macginleyi]